MIDFYVVLKIKKTSTKEEIRNAYIELTKKHHPDKGGDSKIFQIITNAYETLIDEDKKKEYDYTLSKVEKADHFKLKQEYDEYKKYSKPELTDVAKKEIERDLTNQNIYDKIDKQIKNCKFKEKYKHIIIRDVVESQKIQKSEEYKKEKNEFNKWYNSQNKSKNKLNEYLEKYHYPNFPPTYIPLTDEFMERWIVEKQQNLNENIDFLQIERSQDECEHQPEKLFDEANFSKNEENRKKFNELFEKMKKEENTTYDILPANICSSIAGFSIENSYQQINTNWIKHRITKQDLENLTIDEKKEEPIMDINEIMRRRKLEDEEIEKSVNINNSIEPNDKEELFNVSTTHTQHKVKDEYKEEEEIYKKLKNTK
jgi:curved DNA-binding protein CbpA